MFTHPDLDHISLATEFVKNYASQVEISAFAYQFLDCDEVQYEYIPSAVIKKDITAFEENIKTYYPKTPVYTLHAGQKFYFAGAEIEILLTAG